MFNYDDLEVEDVTAEEYPDYIHIHIQIPMNILTCIHIHIPFFTTEHYQAAEERPGKEKGEGKE